MAFGTDPSGAVVEGVPTDSEFAPFVDIPFSEFAQKIRHSNIVKNLQIKGELTEGEIKFTDITENLTLFSSHIVRMIIKAIAR